MTGVNSSRARNSQGIVKSTTEARAKKTDQRIQRTYRTVQRTIPFNSKNIPNSSTLADPITLPYGDTICKGHLDKFKCDLCHGIQTIFKKLLHGSQAIKSWAKYQDKYLKCIPCV